MENVTLLRWLAILAIFGLVAVLPQLLPTSRISLLLILIVSLPIIVLILRFPVLGLIGIILGAMFVPFSGPGGFNVAVFGVAGLLLIWLLDMIIRKRKIKFITSRVLLPVASFIIISILAFVAGQIRWYLFANQAPLNAQIGGLAIYILSVGALLLAAIQLRNQRGLELLVWLFLTVGAIVLVAQFFRLRLILRWIQPGAGGSMFWTWFVALAFSQAVFNRRLHSIWRLALAALVLVVLYITYVYFGSWKSGWVPSLMVIGAIVYFKYPRRVIFLVPIVVLVGWNLTGQVVATEEYSWSTRLEAWSILADVVKANPILGLGFANYYWYTPLIPIRGYFVNFSSHNQYVDLVAQSGLVGLICFLWIFWELGRVGWSLRDRVPDGFPRAYVYGALGGLIGTLVAGGLGDWVLPFVYNVGLKGFRVSVLGWLFLGGVVVLEQIYRPQAMDKVENI
ncbi:MAG: O-antigen ligase family protein [Anaerolineales bacterium]